jgi:type VI secretion system secreted protein VgrG
MNRQFIFHFDVDGLGKKWVVDSVRGVERVNDVYSFEVWCKPVVSAANLPGLADSVLCKPATLSWGLEDGATRSVHGVVDSIEAGAAGWLVKLAPRLLTLADAVDHTVFVNKDAVEIVTAVLGDRGVHVQSKVARALPKRDQCVQAFEADLGFVSRILADEGVTWFLDDAQPDRILLHDGGFPDQPGGALVVREKHGMVKDRSVFDVALIDRVASEKVSLRDYSFLTPTVDLSATSSAGAGKLERYEYPGGFKEVPLGNTLAQIRLDEARSSRRVLRARTDARGLLPGHVLELQGSDRSSVNGKWLILEVQHAVDAMDADEDPSGEARLTYEAQFVAVPADGAYRPARSPAAKLGGIQTATVAGAPGSEIHTEQHGQIKARFRWDRLAPMDDKSSAWLRVAQPPTSGGFLLPRVGWEQIVGFWATSGDVPLALGRVYNGIAVPPNGLPGKKVMGAFGTMTSPGGGSANRVAMDDTAGNEAMHFNASKDFNERTENDKVTTITGNDTWSVGGDRKLIVGQVHEVVVTGAQKYSVGSCRTVNVTANKGIGVGGGNSVAIGGLRMFNVGGDQTTTCASLKRLVGAAKAEVAVETQARTVTGASAVAVAGSWNVTAGLHESVAVGGACMENVSGAKNIKTPKYDLNALLTLKETLSSKNVDASGRIKEGYKTTCLYDISGTAKMGGSFTVVTATDKITLKGGGLTIEITSGSIEIKGKFDSSVSSVEKDDASHG